MDRAWTETEDEILREKRNAGWTYAAVAAYIGDRTMNSAAGRAAYLRECKARYSHVVPPVKVPPFVLAERDRRANEYRSPAQIMMGDPPFSQSALARNAS